MRTSAIASLVGLLTVSAFAFGAKLKELYLPGAAPVAMPRVAEGPPTPAVKKLLDDLGSDDWRTREKAGRDLAALGEKALPHLRKALLGTDDPEVKQRLGVLVRRLDRAVLVEPKRVTLSAKNESPKQILDAVAKQTGYKIEYADDGRATKYSFEFNDTPFWQAVDAVAEAAGLSIQTDYNDAVVRVYAQDSANPYVAYSGPFRLVATNIGSSRNVQLSAISRRGDTQRVSESLSMSFQIQSEPKNPMLGVLQPELTEAKDELGGSLLLPQQPQGRRSYYPNYYNSGASTHNSYMNVNLTRSDRSATKIRSLKGRVGIILMAGTVPDVSVVDPLKVQKKSFRGRTVEVDLEEVKEDANQKGIYVASFTVKRLGQVDPNRGDDWNWSNTLWQKMELTDDKGNRYFCHGPTVHNNNGTGTVKMAVQFGTDDRRFGRPNTVKFGPPVKLVLNEWVTVTHEVEFEFKDIPLP